MPSGVALSTRIKDSNRERVLAVQPLGSFAVGGQGFDQMLLHGLVVHSVLPP